MKNRTLRRAVLFALILTGFTAGRALGAGFKGLIVGGSAKSIPTDFKCVFDISCAGYLDADYVQVSLLNDRILVFSVLYEGRTREGIELTPKRISLAEAIKLHSLQSGLATPVLGFAKGRNNVTYGLVDIANAIIYDVKGPAAEPSSLVAKVTYTTSHAPVLDASRLEPQQSLLLTNAAGHPTEVSQTNLAQDHGSAVTAHAQQGAPKARVNRPQQPFGFRLGMTKAEVIAAVGKEKVLHSEDTGATSVLQVSTSPAKAPLDDYVLLFGPTGLCKIGGTADVKTNRSGDQMRAKFNELVQIVTSKYGEPQRHYDFVKSGALFKEDDEFMQSLAQEERSLISAWEFPDGSSIEVQAVGKNSFEGWVAVRYEFQPEFSEYVRARETAAKSSF